MWNMHAFSMSLVCIAVPLTQGACDLHASLARPVRSQWRPFGDYGRSTRRREAHQVAFLFTGNFSSCIFAVDFGRLVQQTFGKVQGVRLKYWFPLFLDVEVVLPLRSLLGNGFGVICGC